jgi:ribosomal protein S18 acetylase RimI-like enzyme
MSAAGEQSDDGWRLAPPAPADEAVYFELEALAAAPYYDFVYGDDHEIAATLRRELYARGVGDLAPEFGHLAWLHDRPVAVACFAPGREMKRSRMKAALALARSPSLPADSPVRTRLRQAASVMVELRDEDFYMSRFAIAASERGAGIGPRLMDEIEQRARAAGYDRLALEVESSMQHAVRFWHRAGFEEVGRARVEDPTRGRALEYIHMRKPLGDVA